MAYNGKRVYNRTQYPSQRRRAGTSNSVLRVAFFAGLFLYLECVLHLYMGMALKYAPIHILFAIAGGLVCSALTMPFRRRVNAVLIKVLTVLFCLTFAVEIIAKKILQSYYPLSTLKMAAGNKLTDYADVILSTVISSIPILIVLFLPAILLFVFGSRYMGYERFDIRFSGLIIAAALVVHLIGLGVVHLPWGGDLTPKQLYRVDTNIDDQVEQLGLLNMLR